MTTKNKKLGLAKPEVKKLSKDKAIQELSKKINKNITKKYLETFLK